MKIKGKRTEVNYIEVEVDNRQLYEAVLELVSKRYPEFNGSDYVDSRGRWQIFDYVDHHKGTDEYREGSAATIEDIHVSEWLKDLRTICCV